MPLSDEQHRPPSCHRRQQVGLDDLTFHRRGILSQVKWETRIKLINFVQTAAADQLVMRRLNQNAEVTQ